MHVSFVERLSIGAPSLLLPILPCYGGRTTKGRLAPEANQQ